MESVSIKGESAHGMHQLNFHHQWMTTGSFEIDFYCCFFFVKKVMIYCTSINFAGQLIGLCFSKTKYTITEFELGNRAADIQGGGRRDSRGSGGGGQRNNRGRRGRGRKP